eukprot:12802432-Ditylum_brightwellii.AAC.1
MFVSIPSLPLEDRGGLKKALARKIDNIDNVIMFVHQHRNSHHPAGTDYGLKFGALKEWNDCIFIPQWRKLSRMQEIMLCDQCFSS